LIYHPGLKKGGCMEVISERQVKIFKIKNRNSYGAICDDHFTEGKTEAEAMDRMIKALKRTSKQGKQ
jgi:hypothetical protein